MSREQDRRDAAAWAQEWQIRRKNRRIILIVAAIAAAAIIALAIRFVTVQVTRSTYGSEEEMRAALQGRFESDYAEDIEIIGDDITLTYYEISHYDIDYAEQYGYSEYGDSVYDDRVVKWDYRHGLIKCSWMSDIEVDKDGNLILHKYTTLRRTTADRPTPIDPSMLTNNGRDSSDNDWDEDLEDLNDLYDEQQDSREETQEEADDAGVDATFDESVTAKSGTNK